MKTPKTVSELKRIIQVGTQIEMTRYCGGQPSEKIAGVGTVSKVQTNGFYINRNGNNSYIDFPPASRYAPSIEYPDRFEIYSAGNNPITLEYRIV